MNNTEEIKQHITNEFQKQCTTAPMSTSAIVIVGVLILLWWVGAWGLAEAAATKVSESYDIAKEWIYVFLLIGTMFLLESPYKKLQAALSWDT